MKKYIKTNSGFTLLELMIAMAIAVILLSIAVPSFDSMSTNNRIQAQLRSFGDHLKMARSVSITQQKEVTVCHLNSDPITTASSCDGAWSSGWVAFIDDDNDGVVDSMDNVLKVYDGIAPNVLKVTDDGGTDQNFIRFDTRGLAGSRMTIELCDEDTTGDTLGRAVLMEITGMAAFSRINTTTDVYKDINGNDLDCDD